MLSNNLVTLLLAWTKFYPDDEPLFPGLADKATAKMMQHDCPRAGIPYVNADGEYADFHSLRHVFVTSVLATKPNLVTAFAVCRLSDPKLLLRYGHTDDRKKAETIRKLPLLVPKLKKRVRRGSA